MTDLREPTPPGAADPLHDLYRMSRTAGLGSGDYVAISNTSILALLLGLASLLAMLYPLMSIIPVAAVVCGVLALVQIRSSNGTQSGSAFAVLGIALGLALGGVTVGQIVITDFRERSDEARIDGIVKRFSELIVAKQYDQAYQTLFSDDFKKEFSQEAFQTTWEAYTPRLGAVVSIGWGGRADFIDIKATNTRRAVATCVIQFEKIPKPAEQPIGFVYRDGEWMIEGVKQLFEKPDSTAKPPSPDPRMPLGPTFPSFDAGPG